MSRTIFKPGRGEGSEPAWEIATLYPDQGAWSEGDYLELNTNRLVEFSDGYVEVLPMPTEVHQLILMFLLDALRAFVTPGKLGLALPAPLRVRLRAGKFREPDIVLLLAENAAKRGNRYWNGADLVMEIVSEDDPERDYVRKRQDYAEAGISEYWIVDPRKREIVVLSLSGKEYRQHGTFGESQRARSKLLDGFGVDVSAVFAAGKE